MEYKGIKLAANVVLINKNKRYGKYHKRTKESLDKLADLLEKNNHVLMSEYIKNHEKVLIDFKCGHEPHWITPNDYKHGYRCPKCAREKVNKVQRLKSEKAKKEFSLIVKSKGHILLTSYKGNHEKVLINFNCKHEPHWIAPAHYKNGKGCPKCAEIRTGKFHFDEGKKNFLSLLKKNGHDLIGEYKGGHTKTLIDFKCGHIPHKLTPSNYKQGHHCPKCSGHCQEQAKDNFYLLAEKEGYKIIGEYINKGTKIELQCDKGHFILMNPKSFTALNHRCAKCRNLCPEQTKEKFYSEVKKAGYKLLGEYKGSKIKVKLQCDKGHFWSVNPNGFLACRTRCRRCSGLDPQQAKEEFFKQIESNGHILLSEYSKSQEKVLIDFKCGHEPHWTSPHSYKISKHKCLKCANEATSEKRSQESRKNFPLLVRSNGHLLLSEYGRNCYEKVLIDFKCGHEPYWISPTAYKSGNRCSICSESRGEKIVCNWLDKNNIKCHRQYKLPNKRWKYDIFIPSENLIVEIHGIQHFKFIEHFHRTKETFYERAKRDHEKWAYARSLGYKYLEVDYREHNPELALERFLKEFKEIRRNNKQEERKEEQLTLF